MVNDESQDNTEPKAPLNSKYILIGIIQKADVVYCGRRNYRMEDYLPEICAPSKPSSKKKKK